VNLSESNNSTKHHRIHHPIILFREMWCMG